MAERLSVGTLTSLWQMLTQGIEEVKRADFPLLSLEMLVVRLAYLSEIAQSPEQLLKEVKIALEELRSVVEVGSGVITSSETEDLDWINNWKAFFKPFRVDDTIVIKPTWEDLEDAKEDDMVIEIDPGTAFGTGSHETTKLCILNLKKYVKAGDNDILIDAGSRPGSKDTIKEYVNEYCKDGKLEYVIATHAHQDHIAAFGCNEGIFYSYDIGMIIDFPLTNSNTSSAVSQANALAANSSISALDKFLINFLIDNTEVADIENSSNPNPNKIATALGSPAISPHIPHHLPSL